MKQFCLIFSAVVCCLVVIAKADLVNYVDSGDVQVEEVAQLVCKTTKGTKHMVSKFSTIVDVTNYLRGLSSGHKLHECRTNYLDSLEHLIRVSEDNTDVCGEQKLSLLEDYHRKYVSKVSKHVKEQKRSNKAPKMAKLFFMQYATKISELCELNAINTLKKNKRSYNADEMAQMEQLKKFTDALGMSDFHKGYNGIYLFWNMIDSLDLSKHEKFSKYLAESGSWRAHIQMKEGRRLSALQAVCRYQMYPVYSVTLLPVLRLIDMGYYPTSQELADQLKAEPSIRSAFIAAQICETILPLSIYSDEKLADDQIVALTEEEARGLKRPQLNRIEELIESAPKIETSPSYIATNGLDLSKTYGHQETPIASIKLNVLNRSKIINKMVKILMRHVIKSLTSSSSGGKLMRRGQDQELEPFDDKALKEIQENSLQISEEDEPAENGLARSRRGIWKDFLGSILAVIVAVVYAIWLVIITIIKLGVFGLPSVGLLIAATWGESKKAQQWLDAIWKFGTGLLDP